MARKMCFKVTCARVREVDYPARWPASYGPRPHLVAVDRCF